MYTGKLRIPTNRFCFKCHHRVFHSDVKGYPYVCPHSAIDYDALACVIMDAYESDRAESGRKEIVKGIKYTLQKYQTAHDREIIDDMLMNFTGYTLETLVEKSIGYDYSQYDELEDFD